MGWSPPLYRPSHPSTEFRMSGLERLRICRHSRASGNPAVACRQYHHKAAPFWIPAYAGMTVRGAAGVTVGGPIYAIAGNHPPTAAAAGSAALSGSPSTFQAQLVQAAPARVAAIRPLHSGQGSGSGRRLIVKSHSG